MMMKVVVLCGLFACAAAGRGGSGGSMEVDASGGTDNKNAATIGVHGEGKASSGLHLRMRELEAENDLLKRRYAESQLEVAALKDEMAEHASLMEDPEQEEEPSKHSEVEPDSEEDSLAEEEEDGQEEDGEVLHAPPSLPDFTKDAKEIDSTIKKVKKSLKKMTKTKGYAQANTAFTSFTVAKKAFITKMNDAQFAAIDGLDGTGTCKGIFDKYQAAQTAFMAIKAAKQKIAEQKEFASIATQLTPAVKKANLFATSGFTEGKRNALTEAMTKTVTKADKAACKAAIEGANPPPTSGLKALLIKAVA